MGESITIYECSDCGGVRPNGTIYGCPHCGGVGDAIPLRVFREEDVRPLYEALCMVAVVTCDCTGYYRCNGCERKGPNIAEGALDAFPAPEDW
jgi:hypothetical protein